MDDPFAQVNDLWTVNPIKLWAEIAENDIANAASGETFIALSNASLFSPSTADPATNSISLDLSSATLDFGLNEVPQATLSVAVGRKMDNVASIAPLHYLIEVLQTQVPIKVYCQISSTSGTKFEFWPAAPFLAFDGIVTHAGYRTMYGAAEFAILVSHWLVQLGYSSTLSRSSSPANPIQISYDAALPDYNSAGASLLNKWNEVATTQLQTLMAGPVVQKDLWGFTQSIPITTSSGFAVVETGGIQQFLLALASRDRFNWRTLQTFNNACKPGEIAQANNEATTALNRFEPTVSGGDYELGVPLNLVPQFDAAAVAQRIAYEIATETPEKLANHTFWDKLVGEYAPSYLFSVVPLVDRALVVPFTPGLRQDDGALSQEVIYAREISEFDMARTVPKPIRGVGLFLERALATNAAVTAGRSIDLSLLPMYDTCQDGIIVFKHGPSWLVNTTLANFETLKTVLDNPIPANQGAQAPAQLPFADATLLPANQQLWQAYCQALYIQEVLRYRQARLSGKLRFDLAPGSAVAVEVPNDRFVNAAINEDGSSDFLFGTVMRVSIAINAEAQKAGTSLQIGFIRNAAEDKSNNTSIDSHPIWATPWYGAPLVNFN